MKVDYKKFIDKDTAREKFIKFRKIIMDASEKGNFDETFSDICTKALEGDAVAQDCVAYFYNKGLLGNLKANYDLYMSWEILACANGNCFAIDKLEFFLKYALDVIFSVDRVLYDAIRKGNITKDNGLYVISNLLCESIVDILKIDPKELIQRDNTSQPFSNDVNRKYVDALETSMPIVVQYIISG